MDIYITPKTKMFGLCYPHNPLGFLYPKEDLELILRLSEKYGFYIMNDEVWSDIIYPDAEFTSIVSLGDKLNARTLSVFGFSKSFSIVGLRAGCIYCQNKELFDRVAEASEVNSTIGGISSLSQIAVMVVMPIISITTTGGFSVMVRNLPSSYFDPWASGFLGIAGILMWIIPTNFVSQENFLRICGAKNAKEAKGATVTASLLVYLPYFQL